MSHVNKCIQGRQPVKCRALGACLVFEEWHISQCGWSRVYGEDSSRRDFSSSLSGGESILKRRKRSAGLNADGSSNKMSSGCWIEQRGGH